MKNKLKKIALKVILPLLFWLGIWEISALIIGNEFLLPDIKSTVLSLIKLLCSAGFYTAILLSSARVITGLLLGFLAGIALALLCSRFALFRSLFTPILRIIKSTPVASFIVVLWVMMSGDALSVFIGFLMVMPIIYQNLTDGLSAIDKQLSEVSDVFEFSKKKRFMLLTYPTLKKYLVPAVITASGLGWKAEIAAEIIAYTKHSIGQGINDAKYNMDTPTVFAWTAVIILLSIALESGARYLLRRTDK